MCSGRRVSVSRTFRRHRRNRKVGVEMNGPLAWPAIGRPTCEPPKMSSFLALIHYCQAISTPVLPKGRMKPISLLSNAALGLAAITTPRLPGYLSRREISINAADYPAYHIEIPVSHGSGYSLRRRRPDCVDCLAPICDDNRHEALSVPARSFARGDDVSTYVTPADSNEGRPLQCFRQPDVREP